MPKSITIQLSEAELVTLIDVLEFMHSYSIYDSEPEQLKELEGLLEIFKTAKTGT